MKWVTSMDISQFAAHATTHLHRDPVGNTIACTILAERHGGGWPVEPGSLWLCVQEGPTGGASDAAGPGPPDPARHRLVGAALCTPPRPLLLTAMPESAVDALVEHLSGAHVPLSGVDGPVGLSARFARRWGAATASTARPEPGYRLFRLAGLRPPAAVAGRPREAGGADRSLLDRWASAFDSEARPHHSGPDPAVQISRRLELGGLIWLWQLPGAAEPVSMLWLHLPTAGVVRISHVYTPPPARRRGYASACVAAVSRYLLDRGAAECVLTTDLRNPTSNKIYEAIGYRPVHDTRLWRFGPTGARQP